jgi:hypothetical protein
MTQMRRSTRTPEELPPTWYCRDCDAFLPRELFKVVHYRTVDGTTWYYCRPQCHHHYRVTQNAYARRERERRGVVSREERRAAAARHAAQEAAERARKVARRHGFTAAICRYVADLWGKSPHWLVARGRTPDRVEARALVTAILYREHGLGITETSRCIKRDHSTALHLLRSFEPRPEFQELLADYRHMRQQRRAARARKAG